MSLSRVLIWVGGQVVASGEGLCKRQIRDESHDLKLRG